MTRSVSELKTENKDKSMEGQSFWAFSYPKFEPTKGEFDTKFVFHPYQYGSRKLSERTMKSDSEMYVADSYDEAVEKFDSFVAEAEEDAIKKIREEFKNKYINRKNQK